MELTSRDIEQDHLAEIRELARRLASRDPRELEEQVYKSFTFDLCPECQKKYLKNPLPKSTERDNEKERRELWE